MRMHHGLRRWLCSGLLLAIVFTQVVASAYACPTNLGADQAPASQAGTPCDAMLVTGTTLDVAQPGLCAHHCQIASTLSPSDAGPTVPVPVMALAIGHVALAPAPSAVVDRMPWLQRERVHDQVPRLSHSIAHCCYRL